MPTFFDEYEMPTQIPDNDFKPLTPMQMEEKTEKQLQAFESLLHSLDSTLDKKKELWKQIYENAITDRKNSYLVWADLYMNVFSKPAEHAIHGQTLSKYMERVSKANDQLIKLAELVANAEEKVSAPTEEALSDEDMYSAIKAKKSPH